MRLSAIATSPLCVAYSRGVNPSAVEACGSAPASISSRTTGAWDPATAHISAVLRVSVVVAFTSAPCRRSVSTTSRCPVRAAVISGVSPLVRRAPVLAPAASSFSTMAVLASLRRPLERRHAVVVGRVHVGPGAEQQIDHLQVVPMCGPEQRGGPVRAARVDTGALGNQRAHRHRIATGRGRDEPRILSGRRARNGGHAQQQHPGEHPTRDPFAHRCLSSPSTG